MILKWKENVWTMTILLLYIYVYEVWNFSIRGQQLVQRVHIYIIGVEMVIKVVFLTLIKLAFVFRPRLWPLLGVPQPKVCSQAIRKPGRIYVPSRP